MYAMNSRTWNRAQRTREQRRADVVKQRQLAEAARRARAAELRAKFAPAPPVHHYVGGL